MHSPQGWESLPNTYRRWVHEMGLPSIPPEPLATCGSCAMVPLKRASALHTGSTFFNERTKCCTFLPSIPNYLVGDALVRANTKGEASAPLLARIQDDATATPLGVRMSTRYRLLYDAASAFGQSEELLCPHYLAEGGLCGIWESRNSVCATWYCKHALGADGQRYWQQLRDLLGEVEVSLSVALALAVAGESCDPDPEESSSAHAELVPDAARRKAQQRWGSWYSRRNEFFEACAARADAMNWSDVERISGAKVTYRRQKLQRLLSSQNQVVEDLTLEVGEYTVVGVLERSILLRTYSPYDPLAVSPELLQALSAFDGYRPVWRVAAELLAEHGLEIDLATVERLRRHAVLVSPADRGQASSPNAVRP